MDNILLAKTTTKISGIRNILRSIIKEEVSQKPTFKVTYVPMNKKAKVVKYQRDNDISTEAED